LILAPNIARYAARFSGRLMLGEAVLAISAEREHRTAFSLELHRVHEIERVIGARFGKALPFDGADPFLLAAHLAAAKELDLYEWAGYYAPWTRYHAWIVDAAIERGGKPKHMQAADDCARLLGVTLAERTDLDLRTIGACDVTRDTRDAIALDRKRARDRDRAAAKRAAAGARPRSVYEATSISRLEPWEQLGVSRRTWYRMGRPTPIGTGSSLITIDPIITRDGLVPPMPQYGPATPAAGLGVRGAVAPAEEGGAIGKAA
jgi:hypothetical protein